MGNENARLQTLREALGLQLNSKARLLEAAEDFEQAMQRR